jgi:hypothetical protein
MTFDDFNSVFKHSSMSKINRDFGDHDLRIIVYGIKGETVISVRLDRKRLLCSIP